MKVASGGKLGSTVGLADGGVGVRELVGVGVPVLAPVAVGSGVFATAVELGGTGVSVAVADTPVDAGVRTTLVTVGEAAAIGVLATTVSVGVGTTGKAVAVAVAVGGACWSCAATSARTRCSLKNEPSSGPPTWENPTRTITTTTGSVKYRSQAMWPSCKGAERTNVDAKEGDQRVGSVHPLLRTNEHLRISQ
jgi:hypothetical protein